jgi:hypothetical protein
MPPGEEAGVSPKPQSADPDLIDTLAHEFIVAAGDGVAVKAEAGPVTSDGPALADSTHAGSAQADPASPSDALVRALVTGLAMTHSPELLSLVLVGSKGGAALAGLGGLLGAGGVLRRGRGVVVVAGGGRWRVCR